MFERIDVNKVFFDVSTFARVSDWDLVESQKLGRFVARELPQNGRGLNVGSGYQQVFEKEILLERPDVKIVSIDPSLGMTGYKVDLNGGVFDRFKVRTLEENRERILGLQNKENTTIAIGQYLPFSDDFFDFGFDIYAASKYALNEEAYKRYLKEVKRVVKGNFYIAEVYDGHVMGEDQVPTKIRNAKRIFKELGIENTIFVNKYNGATIDSKIIIIGAALC